MNYELMSKNLKFLSTDMVNAANSGHSGVAMGLADVLAVLSSHIKLNPKNPNYENRDRLVFSGGHASALIYAYLHLLGFPIPLADMKNFRQMKSICAGHPELFCPGVEIATGPLGQGIANAVGFAMAAKYANAQLGQEVFDHKVYCLCGDGDLQEGVAMEALSFLATFRPDNFVLIYDRNQITIEGHIDLAFKDCVHARFRAIGFEVIDINGHDHKEIDAALTIAKNAKRPVLIVANTVIGKGALELEGTAKSHGSPLGADLSKRAKEAANWPQELFYIDEKAKFFFLKAMENDYEAEWKARITPDLRAKINALFSADTAKAIDSLEKLANELSSKDMATRDSNELCLNAIASSFPAFLGGSADLGPSNKTVLKAPDFPQGANVHYGIREHGMAAMNNAFAKYGLVPYAATFLVFSDYLKPSVRMASLMKLKAFFVFSHDSISVGEDGPTHQPIEQLSALRGIPDLRVYRPSSAAQNALCWIDALKHAGPSAMIVSRQTLKTPELKALRGNVENGGYLIKEAKGEAKITLIASGSELELALEVAKELGDSVNVIDLPCFEVFDKQECEYKKDLLKGKVFGIEAARSYELYKFCDHVFMMNSFGECGKEKDVREHFGFSKDKVVAFIKERL